MKSLIIPIHSFIDVITNSSTVIYVQTHGNTIKNAKELINELLSATDSTKTADELFDFERHPNDSYRDNYVDRRFDEISIEEGLDYNYATPEYKALEKRIEDEYNDMLLHPEKRPDNWAQDGDYGWDLHDLLIKPKNKNQEVINLTETICNIFELDGTRDG